MNKFINENNIKQIFVSKSVYDNMGFFERKSNNNIDNALFIGIYNNHDILNVKNYKGKKFILWCGNDCNPQYENRKQNVIYLQEFNIVNYCNNSLTDSFLNKLNIKCELIDNNINNSVINYLVDHIYLLYIYESEIKKYETTISHNNINLNIEYFLGVNGNETNTIGKQFNINTYQDSTLKTFIKIATKASAELIARSYNHSYGMPIIISRGNNVFGPNQYPEKLIPRFIELLKADKKVTIQGDGSTVRAFLHSYDTARAFECILEKGEIGEIYNIGCDEGMEYSVMDIAKILIKLIKNTENYGQWIEYIKDRPFNDQRYYISNKKLKNLGWDIQLDLITGLNDLL